MEEKKYHHGNLKQEMIKEGIKLVTTKGDSELSLRKLASICGVSASATYSHFKDKLIFKYGEKNKNLKYVGLSIKKLT